MLTSLLMPALKVLTLTSNWVSRIFWFGHAEGMIQKMRSIFFERSKNNGVPVTQPAGCRGKTNKFIIESKKIKDPTRIKITHPAYKYV